MNIAIKPQKTARNRGIIFLVRIIFINILLPLYRGKGFMALVLSGVYALYLVYPATGQRRLFPVW
jgi:hypothetical protein